MKASDFNPRRGTKPVRSGRFRIPAISCNIGFIPRISHEKSFFKGAAELLVSRPSRDQLIVVMKIPPAENPAPKAFLYAAKPLTDADFDRDISGKRVVTIQSSRFILEQQLDPNWYKMRCG
jgi:hypothetical protein